MIAVLKSPKKPQREAVEEAAYCEEHFPAMRMVRSSRLARRAAKWLLILLALVSVSMLVWPWQQSVNGGGKVVANDPFERPQVVKARVKGIVLKSGPGVFENAYVEEGDILFEIRNQNIEYLEQLNNQVENVVGQISQNDQEIANSINQQRIINEAVTEVEGQRAEQGESLRAKLRSIDAKVRKAEADVEAAKTDVDAEEANRVMMEIDFGRQQRLKDAGAASVAKFQEVEAKFRAAEQKVIAAKAKVVSASEFVTSLQREKDAVLREGEAKLRELAAKIKDSQAKAEELEVKIASVRGKRKDLENKLLENQGKLAAQEQQTVYAPRAGRIQSMQVEPGSSIVKESDPLCTIVPDITKPAVELKVKGNDARWVKAGDPVRLQFEGWPALQFPGYPQAAWGTFAGLVDRVDPGSDAQGDFRVVVTPVEADDEQPWPDQTKLRQGNRANGWILLEQVPVGYEIWRQLNGFPPTLPEQKAGSVEKPMKPPKPKIGRSVL